MKKTLLVLTLLFISYWSARAQDGFTDPRISVGFSLGATVGPHATDYPAAGGLNLKLEYPIGDSHLSVLGITGYTFYVSKDGYYYDSYYGSTGSIVSSVPLQVGLRYYADKLFFEADGGVSFNINNNHLLYTASNVAPLVSPSVGYAFRFGSGRAGLDLSAGYETRIESSRPLFQLGSYNQVVVRAAFSLGL